MGGKEGNSRRKSGFSGAAPYGGGDFGPVPCETEGNQDAISITEVSVLEINGRSKFENFTGRFAKFRKPRRGESKSKQEVVKGWKALGAFKK